MKINKKDLFNEYGIELNKGKYKIKTNSTNYSIYTVLDDSLGCVLCGKNTHVGMLSESKKTLEAFMKRIEGEKDITVEIIR